MLNVVNLKHRDTTESWLHIKDADGNPIYARVKSGKLYHGDEDDNVELIPSRIKFKSVHGEAFRKAFFKMNVKLARLKEGKKKQYEELSEKSAELSPDDVIDGITDAFLDAEELAIDMITELSVDWDGFFDENERPLEFKPEYLRFVISQIENYHVLQQIRDAFKGQEDFMKA